MPRVTPMLLKGRFSFDNYGDEATVEIDGVYDISTISNQNRYETVLFRTMGFGPCQIQLYTDGHPSPDDVLELLAHSKFRALGI